MGKKKRKHHRHSNGERHRDGRDHAEMRFDVPPQVAGIAAAALQQVNTPAFRQLIAGALGAAVQAFDQRRTPPQPAAPNPPAPPVPPQPAAPNPPAPPVPPQPAFTAVGQTSPHEAIERVAEQAGRAVETAAASAARAIEAAAHALERWTERQFGPQPDAGIDRDPPHA